MANNHGGKRKGAGAKETGLGNKKFSDFVTAEQKNEFVSWIMSEYKKDKRLATWVGDHLYGKAPQPIEGTGDNGELVIKIINYAGDNTSL